MESILVIAAHPDDEVLGCGGTIAKFSNFGHEVNVAFLSDGEKSRNLLSKKIEDKKISIRKTSAIKASKILRINKPTFLTYPDNQLDIIPLLKVIQSIEKLIKKYKPGIVFTHHGGDLNIDHVIANKAVITACRPEYTSSVNKIFFFEVPSSTEWNFNHNIESFRPNWFENIDEYLKLKMQALDCYNDEIREWPHPRSVKGVEVLSQYRGATVGYNAAESFVLGFSKQ